MFSCFSRESSFSRSSFSVGSSFSRSSFSRGSSFSRSSFSRGSSFSRSSFSMGSSFSRSSFSRGSSFSRSSFSRGSSFSRSSFSRGSSFSRSLVFVLRSSFSRYPYTVLLPRWSYYITKLTTLYVQYMMMFNACIMFNPEMTVYTALGTMDCNVSLFQPLT